MFSEKRKFDFFQSLNHVDINLKPRFLIKSGYYIVPSPSTALLSTIEDAPGTFIRTYTQVLKEE